MAELKPCPFCGGEAHTAIKHGFGGRMALVICGNCEASGEAFYAENYFIEEKATEKAIEAWNRRVDNG